MKLIVSHKLESCRLTVSDTKDNLGIGFLSSAIKLSLCERFYTPEVFLYKAGDAFVMVLQGI